MAKPESVTEWAERRRMLNAADYPVDWYPAPREGAVAPVIGLPPPGDHSARFIWWARPCNANAVPASMLWDDVDAPLSQGNPAVTDPTNKARRLADWQHRLESPVTVDQLDDWHAELRGEVDSLKAAGLLDPEEAHDLRELADAAYSHHLEEAISRELNQSQTPS